MNTVTLLTIYTRAFDTTFISALIITVILIGLVLFAIGGYGAYVINERFVSERDWFLRRNPDAASLPDTVVRLRRTRNLALIAVVIGATVAMNGVFADDPARTQAITYATEVIEAPLREQADEIAATRAQFYAASNIDESRLCSEASLAYALDDQHTVVRPDTLIQCGGTDFGSIIYTLPESTNKITVTSGYTAHIVPRNTPLDVYLKVTPGNVS